MQSCTPSPCWAPRPRPQHDATVMAHTNDSARRHHACGVQLCTECSTAAQIGIDAVLHSPTRSGAFHGYGWGRQRSTPGERTAARAAVATAASTFGSDTSRSAAVHRRSALHPGSSALRLPVRTRPHDIVTTRGSEGRQHRGSAAPISSPARGPTRLHRQIESRAQHCSVECGSAAISASPCGSARLHRCALPACHPVPPSLSYPYPHPYPYPYPCLPYGHIALAP